MAKKDIIINFINHPKASLKLYSKKLVFKLLKKDYYENHPQSSFNDFSGFLANSLISPIVYAPFREQDKRCFATMENITRYLTQLSEKENDNPLVSIIMPVYNRVDIVESAIDSVLEQTYSNIELIIVDDGSDDGSKELLESINDQRIRLLHNDSCKGVSNSRNKGLSVAKGKYIAYLDSDNTWDSRYIAAMVGAFIELPDAEVLYSGQLLFKGDSEKPYAVRFGSFNKSLLTNRNYIDLNALCHTHDLFKRIGGFDETLIRLVDYDLIMRMAETTQIYSVPVILSHYFFNKAENTITNIPDYKKYLEIVRDYRETRIENINKTINGLNSNKLTKKVSIIIPSYEALDDIKECIESLFELNIDKSYIDKVKNAIKKLGLELFAIHAGWGPGFEHLLDEDKIKLLKKVFDMACKLNIPVVAVRTFGKSGDKEETKKQFKYVTKLCEQAESRGITLAVKPHINASVYNIATTIQMLDEIDSPALGVNLDAFQL